MQNTEDKKWLYEQLRDNGYDIGSQDEFYQGLDNYEEDAKWCYEQTQLLGLDVGSYDEFESSFRNKPTQDNSSNNPSANPLSERFSVAPDVSKPVETNEKPMLVGTGNIPSAPKPSFGIKSNIPTIAEMTQAKLEGRNSTPAYSMENRPQVLTGFGEGVKQGTEQLGAGLEYAVGEAIAPVVGTSYDDKAALEEIERLQAEGKDVLEETKNITSLSSVAPATARALEFLGAKQGIKAAEKKAEVNRTIQQAIKDAGGDIDAAKSLLAERAGKITKADTIRQHAEATMAKAKPTKGWAWVGSMVPQMAAPVIGMGLTAVTKMPIFAQTLGRLNMGALTASTAGKAMAEARQAGATNADVWSAGIINGAIEYITEEIPFNHYTQRLANAAKNSATSAIKKMASEVGSPANKELQDLLAKANKQLDGKLLSGKNVSDYLADITAESISEGAAEGLQTISSIIYENPEDYPTLTEIINNSIEGLKGGFFMGSILGGASKTAEHRMNRNRRKQQGFVDVAEITLPNNKSAIIEIVTDENGNEVGYVDDVKIPITDNNVIRREQFSFDDFERGQFQLEHDEAYENGRTLETAEEMNDANNMLDITANEVRRIFGASEDSDVDAMLGDNPLQYALSEYDKDPEIGQTIIDYLNAKATADGVIGAAQDRIELEARKAGALIDSRKSESDGMVHPAKMKLDDRGVYIISGNVKLLDDGSVDTNNSDESIIIMDAATGEKSFATAKDLLSLDDAIDPEEEKAIVRENIAETIATEVENKMLGVLPMNVGDTFPVLADDGSQHTVQIASNDGSGIVEVIMDNEAQTTSANKEIIQQMANAYNRNRAEQFAQGYKEQIQSENISQAPDTKVEESSAVIPLDKQGRPDFNAMEPDMFINEYVSRYGEDNAIKIARKNIEAARANIKKIDKKIDDVLDPNQMQSLFEQKSAAEAQLNRYNDILGRMGASEDANETEDEQRSRLKKESGNRIYNLFPDGLPNVESVILADIATGNRIRWSDKTTNGAVTSRGLAAELGLSDSNAERTRRLALISNSAPTPEEYAESLQERLNELGVRYDESSLRDTVLDVYSSVDTRSGAWEALEGIAAGSQQEDIDTDWEDMQKLVAYENAQKQEEREQELPDISMTEDATPITEGEYAELEAQAQAEEQADYDAMMEEQTPPTVKVNHQGNPIDANGALITEKVESIDEITDEDFENPYRSVELPTLPQNVNDVIGANGKPVVIKKNIFERNIINHSDVTPEQSRDILKSALYSPNLYANNQKKKRPYNWVVVNTKGIDGLNKLVLLEISNKKDNIEIVHWHFVDERGLEKLKRQAEREDGQLLILPSDSAEEVGALSDPTLNMPSESKDTTSEPEMQEVGQKNAEENSSTSEDKSTPSIKEVDSKVEIPDVIRGAKWDSTGEPTKMRFKRKGDNFDGYITVGKKKYGRTTSEGEEFDILLEDYGSLESAWNAYEQGEVFISPNLASIIKTILIEKGDSTNQPKANADEQVLFRNVYHGSGSEFDKFDHSYMGTGEGNQAFGWGTYVTEVEGIGKQYARMTSKPRLSFKGDFVNVEGFYNPWRIVSDLFNDHHGKLRDMRNAAERYSSLVEEDNPELKALWEDVKQVLSMVRSGDLKTSPARYLYSVEIPDDNGQNYLYWDKEVAKEVVNDLQDKLNLPNTYFVSNYPQTGERIYKALSELLGGDKAASEFLNKNGYVGISYPADGGNAGKARNYVIFNEADLDIADSVRFRRAKNIALETESAQNRHQPSVVSSANGTKILKNIDSTIEEYEINATKRPNTFLGDIAKAIGAQKQGSGSQYATFEAKNGKVFTIRLADHNARVSTFDAHDEKDGISIIISARENSGINNDGTAHIVEYFYDAIKLRKADGKPLVEILKSIKQTLYSGEYKDTTGLAERGEVNIPEEILFRSAEPAPVFYSNAEYTVKAVKQEKATPEQWLKMIEKNGGLKAGEDKWLGLSDWLKASDKKTLTKQEVLDFIKENQIQIEEVEYAENPQGFEELKKEYDGWLRDGGYDYAWDKLIERYGYDSTVAFDDVGGELVVQYGNTASKLLGGEVSTINSTRLDYTTNGLDNKREIALTVPTIESWNESDEIHFGDAGNGRAIAWVRFGEAETYTDETIAAKKAVDDYLAEMRDKYDTKAGEETDAMSAAEIKHLQELTAKELDSRNRMSRVLVIDEIQSKRHQEGREKGYIPAYEERVAIAQDNLQKAEQEFENKRLLHSSINDNLLSKYGISFVDASYGEINELRNAYENMQLAREGVDVAKDKLRRILRGERDLGIPTAPFEKNWAELAMKRMLRYAAENGFDKVAWTTGEQQADRYDLSKSVDVINAEHNEDGSYNINVATVDDSHFIQEKNIPESRLTELVGKDIALSIVKATQESEDGKAEIEGDNLRIGGSGMKAFYDQMIPSFMNKYGKKWGVKVQDVTLPYLEKSSSVMHSIDVTDAMRESVMLGQPMFRLSDNELSRVEELYDDIKTKYNVPGKIVVMPSREEFEQMLLDNGVPQEKLYDYDLAAYIPDSDTFLINGDGIKDTVQAEQVLFHEVLHKLTREVVTLSGLKWLAKNIPSNRLNALSNALWPNGYDSAEAAIDELISIIGENYIIAEKIVDGTPLSALEAYLNNHITLNEATELAKGIMTDAAKEYSDIWDKVFFETKRLLLHYKNAYYEQQRESRGEQVRGVRETMAKGSSREVSPISQTMLGGQAQMAVGAVGKETATRRAEQRQRAIVAEATDLASSLGVKLNVIEDVNDITDSNTDLQRAKRGAKAWYYVATDQVYFVAPNATSIADAQESVLHEVVAHKGLRDVVGRENFNKFLDKVFYNAAPEIRAQIVGLAAKKGWNFRVATEEYLASLAERGFNDRAERTFWQKVRDLFMDMLREAKIAIGYNINDNDMRYMLWRTYQMQKSQGAMAVAEDVVMQQKMGVGNFRTRPAGESMTEEEQIVADAKANGTYLKAPNGKDTNLTPKQWVTVRTDAFKKWFGDWEKAARIEKLRTSKDATITGDEIEVSDDLKQYKKNAQLYGRTLQGEYTNADTGAVISLQRGRHNGGINEVLQHNYKDVAHLQSVAAIPQIIENGIYIESQPNKDTDTNPDVMEYQMFVCGLKIGGEDYTVLAKVAVDSKGNRYYDHNLVSVEKGKLIDIANNEQSAVSSGFGTTPDTKSTTNSQRKYKELISLLQTNSSKIIDENGEPKVVYHRTPNKFTEFDTDKIGSSSGFGAFGNGFYFSPFVEQYRLYGKYKISAFLNARNPFNLNDENVYDTRMAFGMSPEGQRGWTRTVSKEFTQWLKDNGYDAVVYKTDYNEEEDVVFAPNQIKSATGNVGSFDSNNDDIRFRSTEPILNKGAEKAIKADFDKKVRSAWHQVKEVSIDNRQSLKEYMRMATKAHGVKLPNDDMKNVASYENPYIAQVNKSSVNEKEIKQWERKYYKPITKAIDNIFNEADKKADKAMIKALYDVFGVESMDDVLNNYLQGKHGLERNRDKAVRNAISKIEDKETKKTMTEKWEATQKAIRSNKDMSWSEKQHELDAAAQSEFGVDLTARDYSGLGEVFPNDYNYLQDSIKDAYKAVEAFENVFDTEGLWSAIKAANDATLLKAFRSGIISKSTMDSIENMYEYYIPLRGFDSLTTEDVYGYLNNEPKAFSMAVKRANGRASKAEFPIPHMLQMAHSTILQGNNNLAKMALANFAQHYPTDLVKQSNVWIKFNDVTGEWEAQYPDTADNATIAEVSAAIDEHNKNMTELAKKNPSMYRKVTNNLDVPYIVPKGLKHNHQIPYKRNGVDYVLTVSGSPRLAYSMNGELEKVEGIYGKAGEEFEGFTRYLASMYTQYNPDFMVSNAYRDASWVLVTTPIRENAKYTARFYKNFAKLLTPAKMEILFAKYELGKLDMEDNVQREFANFLNNGGETGYAILKDIEQTKKRVRKDVHPSIWGKVSKLIDMLGIVGRSVEARTRFAAYLTSREEGRDIVRSAYDAKEISVNFNRKGAGSAYNSLADQTTIAKYLGTISETLKVSRAFYNAGMQGLAGVGKLVKYNPIKSASALTSTFVLGIVMAMLNSDDDDYYDLTETVRRQNICFKVGNSWATIPLAIELRAFYGLGDMTVSVVKGKEDYSKHGLPYKVADQILQTFPINVLEGNGGIDALLSTAGNIIMEPLLNEDWQGMPIYREDTYNGDEYIPEWKMVYKHTGSGYIAASKWLSEATGGDEGTRGAIEINPAVVEHIAEGLLGGVMAFTNKIVATTEMALGKREFEWRNIPFANRLVKDSGNAQEAAMNRTYRNNRELYEKMHKQESTYEKIAYDPSRSEEEREEYQKKLDALRASPDYEKLLQFHDATLGIDEAYDALDNPTIPEEDKPDIAELKREANKLLE